MDRVATIRELLETSLDASHVEIIDDSHKHAGHPGAASGGGHFNVLIVSERFAGESTLARHRMVYAAVESLMPSEIHALSIKAVTAEEHSSVKE